MKSFRSLVVLTALLCTNALLADGPPRILSISPVVGSTSGGTLVTIATENLSFDCLICSPPFAAAVSFGGVPAEETRTDGSLVLAVAPPHVAGTVDVTVYGVGGASATAPSAFTYQDKLFRQDYEAVLVPSPLATASNPLPGAHGSLWVTDFWMRNNGAYTALLYFAPPCNACLQPRVTYPTSIEAQQTLQILPERGAPGLLFYVQKSAASSMSYAFRVRDISRSAQNDGTAVPVVREGQFGSVFELLNVPINATSRAALRIFDVDALGSGHARVNVYSLTDPNFFASELVPLTISVPVDDSVKAGFPTVPGYASINDLKTALSLPDGNYRIEVSPLNFRGWAFVAVTKNETQLVTVVAP